MAQLRLAASEFAVELCDRALLEAPAQNFIQLLRARSDLREVLAPLVDFGAGVELQRHDLPHSVNCGYLLP